MLYPVFIIYNTVDILLNHNIAILDQSNKTLEHNQNLEFLCYLSETGNDIGGDTTGQTVSKPPYKGYTEHVKTKCS